MENTKASHFCEAFVFGIVSKKAYLSFSTFN